MKEKSLGKNSVMNFIKTLLGLLFPLITFPYASRVLGVGGIGRVNFANSIINYFVLIAGLGIANYAIREGAKIRDNHQAMNKFCTEMLLINTISTGVAYTGLLLLFLLPSFQAYKDLLLLFSSTILFNIIGVNWLFNIYEEFTYITIRTFLLQLVSLGSLFLFVKTKADYLTYAGILVISSVGANVFNIIYSQRFVRFFPKCKYELQKHIKPILIVFGISVTSTIYLNLDMTMLGLMSGDYEVGLYTAATKLNKVVCNVLASVSIVFLPRLSYYVKQKRKEDFNRLVDRAFYYILGFTIPAAMGMLMLSKEIIIIFSGNSFINAAPTLMIKAPNIILSVLNGFIAIQLFMPLNKEKISFYATFSGAVANCFLNYYMIPLKGAEGAAIATILSESAVLAVCIWNLKKFYPLKRLLKEACKYIVSSTVILVLSFGIHSLNLSNLCNVILITISGSMCYFSILYLLKAELAMEIIRYFHKKQ